MLRLFIIDPEIFFMQAAWQKIKNWIEANHPVMLTTLNDGASSLDFQRLEALTEKELPEDFKGFYRVHNGQNRTTYLNLFDGDLLLEIDCIIDDWQTWKIVLPEINANCRAMFDQPAASSPDKGIKSDWWNLAWVPITTNGSGDSYCLDLDPSAEGTYGQIIRMWHDNPQRELIAPSFREWIYSFISDLEKGVYESSNNVGWGGIIKKQ